MLRSILFFLKKISLNRIIIVRWLSQAYIINLNIVINNNRGKKKINGIVLCRASVIQSTAPNVKQQHYVNTRLSFYLRCFITN